MRRNALTRVVSAHTRRLDADDRGGSRNLMCQAAGCRVAQQQLTAGFFYDRLQAGGRLTGVEGNVDVAGLQHAQDGGYELDFAFDQ